MKCRIEFIIMKIFMKIVKICPKSPRFTVLQIIVFFVLFFHFLNEKLSAPTSNCNIKHNAGYFLSKHCY